MICYVAENVVNIDNRLDIWAQIRNETLDICYNIPDYESKTLEEKNRIYDQIKKEVGAKYLN